MKISYAITSHNEGAYIKRLLDKLIYIKTTVEMTASPNECEIVVVDDYSDDVNTQDILASYPSQIQVYQHALNNDFATHKNFLNGKCTGDWILQLDADEDMRAQFLHNLSIILKSNAEIEAFWLPRTNTVDGITLEHVQKYGWIITTQTGQVTAKVIDPHSKEYELLKGYDLIIGEEDGVIRYNTPIIQWPDPQMRLYKNDPKIKWEGKVHERLTGFENYSSFTMAPAWAIQHHKEIKRQEKQNALYETITR